jgi:hypothetical protein
MSYASRVRVIQIYVEDANRVNIVLIFISDT